MKTRNSYYVKGQQCNGAGRAFLGSDIDTESDDYFRLSLKTARVWAKREAHTASDMMMRRSGQNVLALAGIIAWNGNNGV